MIAFWGRLCRDASGSPAIEFAILMPVFLLLALGALQFGIALNDYLQLTNATDAAARILAISRGSSAPWTALTGELHGAAPSLSSSSMTVTVTVNGAACSSDAGCQVALSNAQGQAASVKVSYPCNLTVYNRNFAPSCALTAQSTEFVQ